MVTVLVPYTRTYTRDWVLSSTSTVLEFYFYLVQVLVLVPLYRTELILLYYCFRSYKYCTSTVWKIEYMYSTFTLCMFFLYLYLYRYIVLILYIFISEATSTSSVLLVVLYVVRSTWSLPCIGSSTCTSTCTVIPFTCAFYRLPDYFERILPYLNNVQQVPPIINVKFLLHFIFRSTSLHNFSLF